MARSIHVKDVMTQNELQTFEELNFAILTSTKKMERNYYNLEIVKLIQNAKKRYFNRKKGLERNNDNIEKSICNC